MNAKAAYLGWTPKTYQEAWETIKRVEGLDTQAAMSQAQDRFPQLFQAFLENCPRAKG